VGVTATGRSVYTNAKSLVHRQALVHTREYPEAAIVMAFWAITAAQRPMVVGGSPFGQFIF
jgi:hypothetical protein